MNSDIFDKLTEKYPFITLCAYANQEYIGIIQNRDDIITTIYDFGSIAAGNLGWFEKAAEWCRSAINMQPQDDRLKNNLSWMESKLAEIRR